MSVLNLIQAETRLPELSVEVQEVDSTEGMVTSNVPPRIPGQLELEMASGGDGSGAANSRGHEASSPLETLLDFDYHLGLMPFRLSSSFSGISDCIVKTIYGFVSVCSLLYSILQIRVFAVFLDEDGKAESTIWFIAIGYQISEMMLQLRYAYLLLWKQARFFDLAALLRATKLPQKWHSERTGRISVIVRILSLATCTVTVFGGFNVIGKGEKWSFRRILRYHENDIYFSIESLVPQSDITSNETTAAGLFFNNSELEEFVLGGTGIALEYIHRIVNSCTHDFFLVSTVTLWLYMRGVRRELKDAQDNKAQYTSAQYRNLVADHEELQNISKQLNEILKLFLPALTMTSIIMASYFTHICFHREWFRAVPYAFKLGKIGFTYILALEISDYEDSFNQWYISQKLPNRLGLDVISVQLKLSEMRHHQVGIGNGIFHIDTRFICSFAGITSSYFFIVTEALAEKGRSCD